MTGYLVSGNVVGGSPLLRDPESARALRIVPPQYKPDSLRYSLQVQGSGGEGGNRSEALHIVPLIEELGAFAADSESPSQDGRVDDSATAAQHSPNQSAYSPNRSQLEHA
jgi:hypothetical protein